MRAQSCPQHPQCLAGHLCGLPACMLHGSALSPACQVCLFILQSNLPRKSPPPTSSPQVPGSSLPRLHRSTQQCTVQQTTRGTWRVPQAHWQTPALPVTSTREMQMASWPGPAGAHRRGSQRRPRWRPRGCSMTSSMGLPSQRRKVCCPFRSVAAAEQYWQYSEVSLSCILWPLLS